MLSIDADSIVFNIPPIKNQIVSQRLLDRNQLNNDVWVVPGLELIRSMDCIGRNPYRPVCFIKQHGNIRIVYALPETTDTQPEVKHL